MDNNVLWLLFALVNFLLVIGVYKLFGKTGLFAWIALGTTLANIQVMKLVGFDLGVYFAVATLGNITYGSLYLVTDALGEKYGKAAAKKAVWLGFYALLATVVVMQITLAFENLDPYPEGVTDPFIAIFGLMPFIAIGSLLAYITSQLLDVYIFAKVKELTNGSKLWLRNLASTPVSQLLDTVVFCTIAFLIPAILQLDGSLPFSIILEIFITTYVIKAIVALLDTPFIYVIKNTKPLNLFEE